MSPTLRLRAIERSFASFRRNRLGRRGLDRRERCTEGGAQFQFNRRAIKLKYLHILSE